MCGHLGCLRLQRDCDMQDAGVDSARYVADRCAGLHFDGFKTAQNCHIGVSGDFGCRNWRRQDVRLNPPYACRFTAPVSGDKGADQDIKDAAADTAEEAKEQSKGLLQSITDGAKYIGERCV